MNVEDLIAKLQQMPPKARVVIDVEDERGFEEVVDVDIATVTAGNSGLRLPRPYETRNQFQVVRIG